MISRKDTLSIIGFIKLRDKAIEDADYLADTMYAAKIATLHDSLRKIYLFSAYHDEDGNYIWEDV